MALGLLLQPGCPFPGSACHLGPHGRPRARDWAEALLRLVAAPICRCRVAFQHHHFLFQAAAQRVRQRRTPLGQANETKAMGCLLRLMHFPAHPLPASWLKPLQGAGTSDFQDTLSIPFLSSLNLDVSAPCPGIKGDFGEKQRQKLGNFLAHLELENSSKWTISL